MTKTMKKKIRLNEREFNRLIRESVKRVLKEGGNLTFRDKNGRMNTNSKDTWHGVPGSTFVWHGEWSDSEIYFDYEGEQYIFNGSEMEDILWSYFREYCEDNGLNPDEHVDDEIYLDFARKEAKSVLLNCGPYNESYEDN